MIRAEELMIGDWISYGGKPVQVLQLSRTEYKGFEPISLAPEILEKNGFKKSESDTLSQTWAWAEKSEKIYNRWVQVTFYNEPINGVSYLTKIETCSRKGDGVNRLHSCDIESVHQFQHALKLVGINLEIKI